MFAFDCAHENSSGNIASGILFSEMPGSAFTPVIFLAAVNLKNDDIAGFKKLKNRGNGKG